MVNECGNINHIFRDVQIPVSVGALDRPAFDRTQLYLFSSSFGYSRDAVVRWCRLIGLLEFSVPFQHKYG